MREDEAAGQAGTDSADTRKDQWLPAALSSRKAALAALGTGLLGSALWDWLAKPGLSQIGRVLISILTLGSAAVRDRAYKSAALDPYPISAAVLVSVLTATLVIIPVLTALHAFRNRLDSDSPAMEAEAKDLEREARRRSAQLRKLPAMLADMAQRIRAGDDSAQPEAEAALRALDEEFAASLRAVNEKHARRKGTVLAEIRRLRRSLLIVSSFAFLAGLACVGQSLAISQAILIRRVFLTDLAICTPHMSSTTRDLLLSRFAAMTTRAEYASIDAQLRDIAQTAGLHLRDETLW